MEGGKSAAPGDEGPTPTQKMQLTGDRDRIIDFMVSARGDFVTDNVHVSLCLTVEGISWRNLVDSREVTLAWPDVITCHRGRVSSGRPTEITGDLDNDKCFTLHYIDRQETRVWRHKYRTFDSSESNFEDILSAVLEKCKKDRPSRLLVFINPVGGRGQGEVKYNRVVAPLFKLAQINTEVIVSQNALHTEEVGDTYDFSRVSGVVVMGGDGTLHKLLHTLLPRVQRDAGIQGGASDTDWTALPFPIGIIPTGTGNGVAKSLYGNDDIETAALNIISGCKTFKNIASISHCGSHLSFSGVLFGHGFWCDLFDTLLEERRLGRFRFFFGMLSAFLRSRREFDVQIDYLPYNTPTDGSEVDNSDTETKPVWKTIEGRYTGVLCCPSVPVPQENTDKCVFDVNAEAMSLVMDKQCGRWTFYSWLYKMTQMHKDAFNGYDFVTTIQVKSFRLRVIGREGTTEREKRLESKMNIDGEIHGVESGGLDITGRLHRNLVKMFGSRTMR
ncbi:ceramide kinase-like isoform X2 [Haliotis cracherodii]|uniref:ceramide kinase-like isoform X2 n=1 Tax=Haliotis cracherodii TaxID=6455 RepID=UPI0039EAFD6D